MNRTPGKSLSPPLLAMILLLWAPAVSQAQDSLDLEQCITYALEHNNEIKGKVFDQYIAEAQIKEFAATGFPQISLAADLQYFIDLPTQILPGFFAPEQEVVFINGAPYPLTKLDPETLQPIPGPEVAAQFGFPWQSNAGVNLNWRALDPAYFYGLEAAREFSTLRRLETNQTRETVAFNVSNAYLQVLITRQQQEYLDLNISRIEDLLQETKALNEEGFVESIDVDRLTINLNNLKLEAQNVSRFGRLSETLLKFQMGMPLSDTLLISNPEVSLNELPPFPLASEEAFDPSGDLDIAILKQAETLQTLDYKRTRSGYLPTLSVFGSYQFNAQRSEFNFFETEQDWFPISVVGVQLNWNIFDSFLRLRKMEQQRLGIDQVQLQQETVSQAAILEYEQAKMELLNAYSSLQSTKANVGLSENIFRVSKIKYLEGVGSSLEVNEATSELRQAENSYLSALYQFLQAEVSFEKAKGGFSMYHSTSLFKP